MNEVVVVVLIWIGLVGSDSPADSRPMQPFTGVYSYIGNFIVTREIIFTVSLAALVISWFALCSALRFFFLARSNRLLKSDLISVDGTTADDLLDSLWGVVGDSLDKMNDVFGYDEWDGAADNDVEEEEEWESQGIAS